MIITCLDSEKYKIPGYASIYFISKEVDESNNYIKAAFNQNSLPNSYSRLNLVLEDIGTNKKILGNRYLKNAKIFDRDNEINLIDLIQGIEIKITGKKTDIKISYNNIIEKNTQFRIIERDKFLNIPIDSFLLLDGKCEIEIKAPNIDLQTWKAVFVIGHGETGSL